MEVEAGTVVSGTVVAGRFRVEAELGRGGMGVVYRATQLPMERPVALKLLRAELTAAPKARARFEREARALSALPHPSAVAIFDFGEHEGTAYLAMELLEGETLAARVSRGPLDAAAAIDVATQLADVLAAAHAVGLVHRDLKPENVVLQGGAVRVLDFGLAFLAAEDGPGGRMTREGVVVGTPAYLSPEQARGEAVGPPTDVYALGCVLHELITGRPPFSGTEMEVLTKQMFAPPPPLAREGGLEVPAALDALRRAMLDKSPDRRPEAAEARDRLALLDPDPDRGRVRASADGYLGARAARMVNAAPRAEAGSDAPEVGVVGAVTPELMLGLSANGIAAFVVTDAEPVDAATRALYAPGASEAEVRALAEAGPPVLTDADRGDLGRLTAMLAAGAADVVLRPVSAAELARKLLRAARDAEPARR